MAHGETLPKMGRRERSPMAQVLPRLPPLPEGGYNYYEPFLGGGALFFQLESEGMVKTAHLSDISLRADFVLTIENDVELLIEELKRLEKNFQNVMRTGRSSSTPSVKNGMKNSAPRLMIFLRRMPRSASPKRFFSTKHVSMDCSV